MTTIYRVEFYTADDDSHPVLMTREEALAYLRSARFTEWHDEHGVTRIEDLDDGKLSRAIIAATTKWVDESGSKWVRFVEKGLAEGGVAAVRADRIRFVRVTVEYGEDDDDDDDDGGDGLVGFRVDLPPPPNGWMN